MEEEIVIINNTKKTLKATLIEEIKYDSRRVYANDFRVFDKDIPIAKREFRITVEEGEGQ
ncbi:hypothetical protein DRN52_04675 [Thermococci archaeon]|nr:MAG: hypothetical protein DRN52_04675 [Thermococci archaeon]